MQKKFSKKLLSLILSMMLIVAMALCTTACGGKKSTTEDSQVKTESSTNEKAGTSDDSNVLGEGNTEFTCTVVDKEGNETVFEIHTDKTTVGEALLEVGLIDGDVEDYGLYVKEVNGITADYDVDGTYWAFYINDEYASTGVDSTNITEGDNYSFKVE